MTRLTAGGQPGAVIRLLDDPATLRAEHVTSAYQAQVRDIAPDRLLDREDELNALVGFCAGTGGRRR